MNAQIALYCILESDISSSKQIRAWDRNSTQIGSHPWPGMRCSQSLATCKGVNRRACAEAFLF